MKLTDRTRGIINDITEDIDNRESRKVLRETVVELANALESKEQAEQAKQHAELMKLLRSVVKSKQS